MILGGVGGEASPRSLEQNSRDVRERGLSEKRQFQTENDLCEAWGLMPLEGQKGREYGYDRESEGDWMAQGTEWHLELHWRRHNRLLSK